MTDLTHLSEGHAIIAKFEARAQEIASIYPAVKFLMPAIAACLHDLLTHLSQSPAASPLEKTLEATADTLVAQVQTDIMSPELPLPIPPAPMVVTVEPTSVPPASEGAAAN